MATTSRTPPKTAAPSWQALTDADLRERALDYRRQPRVLARQLEGLQRRENEAVISGHHAALARIRDERRNAMAILENAAMVKRDVTAELGRRVKREEATRRAPLSVYLQERDQLRTRLADTRTRHLDATASGNEEVMRTLMCEGQQVASELANLEALIEDARRQESVDRDHAVDQTYARTVHEIRESLEDACELAEDLDREVDEVTQRVAAIDQLFARAAAIDPLLTQAQADALNPAEGRARLRGRLQRRLIAAGLIPGSALTSEERTRTIAAEVERWTRRFLRDLERCAPRRTGGQS